MHSFTQNYHAEGRGGTFDKAENKTVLVLRKYSSVISWNIF